MASLQLRACHSAPAPTCGSRGARAAKADGNVLAQLCPSSGAQGAVQARRATPCHSNTRHPALFAAAAWRMFQGLRLGVLAPPSDLDVALKCSNCAEPQPQGWSQALPSLHLPRACIRLPHAAAPCDDAAAAWRGPLGGVSLA